LIGRICKAKRFPWQTIKDDRLHFHVENILKFVLQEWARCRRVD
jgi:hypothetical protein